MKEGSAHSSLVEFGSEKTTTWVPKNAKFDSDYKAVEKVTKNHSPKKLEGRLHTVLKDEKPIRTF